MTAPIIKTYEGCGPHDVSLVGGKHTLFSKNGTLQIYSQNGTISGPLSHYQQVEFFLPQPEQLHILSQDSDAVSILSIEMTEEEYQLGQYRQIRAKEIGRLQDAAVAKFKEEIERNFTMLDPEDILEAAGRAIQEMFPRHRVISRSGTGYSSLDVYEGE